MVSRRLTTGIPVERTYLSPADYADLYAAEVPASGPAGSVLAYRPDVYHRGVRMTAPAAARFMLHVSYKPGATDWLGSFGLPNAGEDMAWHRFVQRATVRQLTVLGFPTPVIPTGPRRRWPGWRPATRCSTCRPGGTRCSTRRT